MALIPLVPLPYKIPFDVKVLRPVPPSATVKSVIPVIVPPVIAALEDSMFATSVATAYPVPLVSTVVVGAA